MSKKSSIFATANKAEKVFKFCCNLLKLTNFGKVLEWLKRPAWKASKR